MMPIFLRKTCIGYAEIFFRKYLFELHKFQNSANQIKNCFKSHCENVISQEPVHEKFVTQIMEFKDVIYKFL